MRIRNIHAHALSLGTLALILNPAATHAQASPEATVRQWMTAFNAGDMNKAAAFNSPAGMSVIDEFAPFSWNGPKAFADWGAAFEADAKSKGLTEPRVTLGTLVVQNLTATEAYLIFPSVYTYKQNGVAMRESAHLAISLRTESSAWKIVSWAWTGTVPHPAR